MDTDRSSWGQGSAAKEGDSDDGGEGVGLSVRFTSVICESFAGVVNCPWIGWLIDFREEVTATARQLALDQGPEQVRTSDVVGCRVRRCRDSQLRHKMRVIIPADQHQQPLIK